MNKKIIIGIIIFALILFIRFIVGGPEDSWICINGDWVKHGNPKNNPEILSTKKIEEKITNLPEVLSFFRQLNKNNSKGFVLAEKINKGWFVKVGESLKDHNVTQYWYQVDNCGNIKKLEI